MATLLITRTTAGVELNVESPATIPNPAKVEATAAQIRRAWSPRTRRYRAQLARRMLHAYFLDALFGPLEPVRVPVTLTPRRRI
jgi:hypothetical protein